MSTVDKAGGNLVWISWRSAKNAIRRMLLWRATSQLLCFGATVAGGEAGQLPFSRSRPAQSHWDARFDRQLP